MKLYEINEEIEALIDKATGEITDADALEALQMERADKVRNIVLYVKNLRADAKAYGDEEAAFRLRRQRAEAKADWLTLYLKKHLDGQPVKEPLFEISWRTSKATDIVDESAVPVDYKKWQAPKIDKDAILRALKAGQTVPGARLVERQNMTIK